MTTKKRNFDAVAESRKWKVAVARETENMTHEEELEFFSPEASRKRFRKRLEQVYRHEDSVPSQHD